MIRTLVRRQAHVYFTRSCGLFDLPCVLKYEDVVAQGRLALAGFILAGRVNLARRPSWVYPIRD
jgi:GT2 family glycosyltransferase